MLEVGAPSLLGSSTFRYHAILGTGFRRDGSVKRSGSESFEYKFLEYLGDSALRAPFAGMG